MTPTTVALAALAAGVGTWLVWQSLRAVALPASAPDRLVAELRLAQLASLTLAVTAGAYVGFALDHEYQPAAALDLALVGAFFAIAVWAPMRDPREALTVLALAFAAHAVVDVLHRPGTPLAPIVPRWYVLSCAIYDAVVAAVCYLPILLRRRA